MTNLPASLTSELGHGSAGYGSTSGWPWDQAEWSPELQWPLSIGVYDKMRRQDAQVAGVLRAVTLPIRRARWYLDPNGARDEIVAHVAQDFGLPILDGEAPSVGRQRGRFQWGEHLRMVLLQLAYGHMPFEQVYRIDDGLRAHLSKLAPRMPATISKINVNRAGSLESIEQYASGMAGDVGTGIVIPIERLVMYVTDREAGAWQGQSVLRSAYKHWMLKDRLLRVDAMKHERNGMGIPTFEAPEGASAAMMTELNALAQAYRAGDASGGAVPAGAKLRLVGVEGSLPDTLASIRYHDEQIARMMLAQFLQLGTTASGSRALGETFVDFFTLALQTVADEVAQTTTAYAVEDLVDLNWGEDEAAPKVVCSTIGADQEITAEGLAALLSSAALTADDTLEDWLRQMFRMPPRDDTTARAHTVPGVGVAAGGGGSSGKVAARVTPGLAEKAPQAEYQTALTGHYTPRIGQGIVGMLDPATVAADFWAQAAHLVSAAASQPAMVNAETFVRGLTVDSDALTEAVTDAYADAYLAGAHAGDLALGDLGVDVAAPVGATIDWAHWQPGNPAAAAELAGDAGRGLAQLLADADVQIQGMVGTTLDTLGVLLAGAVDEGLSVDATANLIREALANPARAEIIAQTETARAVTVATLDQYALNGVAGKTWLLSDGACPLCEENADAGDITIGDEFPNGDPPVHPSCVCAVGPVLDA